MFLPFNSRLFTKHFASFSLLKLVLLIVLLIFVITFLRFTSYYLTGKGLGTYVSYLYPIIFFSSLKTLDLLQLFIIFIIILWLFHWRCLPTHFTYLWPLTPPWPLTLTLSMPLNYNSLSTCPLTFPIPLPLTIYFPSTWHLPLTLNLYLPFILLFTCHQPLIFFDASASYFSTDFTAEYFSSMLFNLSLS